MRRLSRRNLAGRHRHQPAKTDPTFGVRVGVSGDPDQFFFGAHVETSPIIDHLTFRPNAEIGVGDDETLVAFNFEFAYWIPLKNQPWRVYLGGGPALVIRSFHEGHPHDGDSDVGGGLNFLLGIQHRKGLFAELKVGAIDSPRSSSPSGTSSNNSFCHNLSQWRSTSR